MNVSVFSKKITALLLCIFIMLSLACCDKQGEESTTVPQESETEAVIPGGSLSVPYTSSDSLNPFFCNTVLNATLSSLVYRSLYRLDTSFSPVRDLALSESITGLTLKVFIVPDLVFCDGAVLSAEDVVYSFECAEKSEIFSPALSGIVSCKAGDSGSVEFELASPDVNILNALIFPIVKKGTSESKNSLPVGNGYYQYNQDGIRLSLKSNLKYAGSLPEIGTVRLTDVKGNTTPENLITTNEIDFCYNDLSDASVTGVNTSSTGIYLNNLVYMGINHENVNLALASFRQAIAYAIDRQMIAENAFRGYARAAAVPFNTSWSEYSSSLSASSLSFSADAVKTQELLSARGFGTDGIAMNLLLVCNEANAFIRNTANEIAAALKPFNINVTVQLLSSENLKKTVEAGLYDLYIAEIKIPATMDLSQFFSVTGGASYGINFNNCTVDEAYFRYKVGEITLDDFISYFNSDMPFIPLVYRNGRFLYTRKITSELTATEGFFFSDMHNWTFSELTD